MKKYRRGYTCGVFDMFHTGHLNLLERCKAMCDCLIVGVCDDDYVRNVKRTEPVMPENDRVRILKPHRVPALHSRNKHNGNQAEAQGLIMKKTVRLM